MARKISTHKLKQAISRYNNAVNKYNREVRAHNSRVRANRQRLNRELAKLSRMPRSTSYVVYRSSVQTLHQSFTRVEGAVEAGTWKGGEELFDLTENETANSVAVLNTLVEDPPPESVIEADSSLQATSISDELSQIDSDLHARWRGALFSLSPNNPDAGRHFCASARELISSILESAAPDDLVKAANPQYERTPEGGVSRRARIRFCLQRRENYDQSLEVFVEDDIKNVITLFRAFNDGTHGSAGRFSLAQLATLKKRVEDAILFLYRVLR